MDSPRLIVPLCMGKAIRIQRAKTLNLTENSQIQSFLTAKKQCSSTFWSQFSFQGLFKKRYPPHSRFFWAFGVFGNVPNIYIPEIYIHMYFILYLAVNSMHIKCEYKLIFSTVKWYCINSLVSDTIYIITVANLDNSQTGTFSKRYLHVVTSMSNQIWCHRLAWCSAYHKVHLLDFLWMLISAFVKV